jgi:hypothetical protein
MVGIPIDDAAKQPGLTVGELKAMIADGRLSSFKEGGVELVDPKAVSTLVELKQEKDKTGKLTVEVGALQAVISPPQSKSPADWLIAGATLLIAAAGVWVAYCQIGNAINTLQTNNDYKMQMDHADAFKAIIDSPSGKTEYYSQLYDTKFESMRDLYRNGGISRASWTTLVARTCPALNKQAFSFGNAKLEAAKKICDEFKTSWESGNAGLEKKNRSGDFLRCWLCPGLGSRGDSQSN